MTPLRLSDRHLCSRLRTWACRASLGLLLVTALQAAAAVEQTPFDLAGPQVTLRVKRGAAVLPIAEVPSLAPHDRVSIVATVPDANTARYLMVAAFLRGPTDPPPETWFYRCDTWKPPCDRGGLDVEVPEGAQQMVLVFAPKTGGDYRTLVDAVRGKPGAFVRAAQQLRQAALDRARLDRYLALLHDVGTRDPAAVKTTAPLLARSLAIKIDEKCLDRIAALQASCLMQGSDAQIMSDGHGESLVSMVTTGIGRDLAIQAGGTSLLGSGNYSSVIGSILDFGRLMDSLHTAQYVYIPALPSVQGERAALMLNSPPSFHKPMSVLVAALPAVEPVTPPVLRSSANDASHCTSSTPLVLPVEGDALVYSTRYAHDVALVGRTRDGTPFRWNAEPDPLHGGYVIHAAAGVDVDETAPATLEGLWGFDPFKGPTYHLASPRAREWQADSASRATVVAGRTAELTVTGEAACLESIVLKDGTGHDRPVPYAAAGPGALTLQLPLDGVRAGPVVLQFADHGAVAASPLTVTAFEEPSRIESARTHVGDASVDLDGQGLAQIAQLSIGTLVYTPIVDAATDSHHLRLVAGEDVPAHWGAGMSLKAVAHLHDGRTLPVTVSVLAPRPRLRQLALSTRVDGDTDGLPIELGDSSDLPIRATATFSLRTDPASRFPSSVHLDAEAPEADATHRLDLKSGGLTLIDGRTLVATLELAKAFGPSAFGPVRYRLSTGEDTSDWLTLGNLVRLPALKAPTCPTETSLPCVLSGTRLYLIESVAVTRSGEGAVHLEEGFPGDAVPIPRPTDGHLYLRLRDDPEHQATITLPTVH